MNETGYRLTDVVYGGFQRHERCSSGKDANFLLSAKERATEFWEVTDKDTRVELPKKQSLSGILEQCLAKVLEPNTLIDITQFVSLQHYR
jgi:hypothetical protein